MTIPATANDVAFLQTAWMTADQLSRDLGFRYVDLRYIDKSKDRLGGSRDVVDESSVGCFDVFTEVVERADREVIWVTWDNLSDDDMGDEAKVRGRHLISLSPLFVHNHWTILGILGGYDVQLVLPNDTSPARVVSTIHDFSRVRDEREDIHKAVDLFLNAEYEFTRKTSGS